MTESEPPSEVHLPFDLRHRWRPRWLHRPRSQLTRSELEIPSGFDRYAARLTSMPRFSARFSAGVSQPSASWGRTSL